MNYIIKNLLFVENPNTHDCVLVDFEPKNHIGHIVSCYIDLYLLSKGIKNFPCNNGEFLSLSDETRLEIADFATTMLFQKKCSQKEHTKTIAQFENLFKNFENIQNELQANS